jgi:hypothetical protein
VRITLSLDDDVADLLQKEMLRSGASLRETVNRYLRLGLTTGQQPARKKFAVKPLPMGLPSGLSYDNIGELLDAIEGPEHR